MVEFFSSFLRRAGMPASAGLSCSSRNSNRFHLSSGVKQGRGYQLFSRFKRQYLENGRRCIQSYY